VIFAIFGRRFAADGAAREMAWAGEAMSGVALRAKDPCGTAPEEVSPDDARPGNGRPPERR
jgi:hypothetical protein